MTEYNGEIGFSTGALEGNYILHKVQHLNTAGGKIKLGVLAGFQGQGDECIAIGNYAGQNYQANNSIIINATGSTLNNSDVNSLKIAPIRNVGGNFPFLNYNPTSKEITYQNVSNLATYYGQFISTDTFNITQNVETIFTFNGTPIASGISYDPLNPSRILFPTASIYKVGASILFSEAGGSGARVYMGYKLGGVPIANSGSIANISGNGHTILAYAEIIIEITDPATQYLEVNAYTTATGITSPTIPAPIPAIPQSPSIILTSYMLI